jgi:predicted flap endonuclease-1-like 5' DNA nuclease
MTQLYLSVTPFKTDVTGLNNVENKETATLEIMIMILGAFLFGFFLRHFIGFFRKKEIIIDKNISAEEEAMHGNGIMNTSISSNNDLATQIANLKREIDKLAAMKLCQCSENDSNSKELKTNSKQEDKKTAAKAESITTEVAKNEKPKPEIKADKKAEPIKQTPAKKDSKANTVKPDDLKLIEGVGPAIEKLLNSKGISTFDQLSVEKTANLEKMLDEAGPRFRVHVPETWPEQARLLKENKMDEFKVLTEKLKGGRRL